MTSFLKKAGLGIVLAASTLAIYAPAQAHDYNNGYNQSGYGRDGDGHRDHWHHHGDYGRGYGHRDEHRDWHHHRDRRDYRDYR